MAVFTSFMLDARALILLYMILWLLLTCGLSNGTPEDVSCLKTIKSSLKDPNNYLTYSWNFDNNTEGFICRFTGVECWHPDENKVLSIKLSDMGLKGDFPRGIRNCTSLTGLDLSNNRLKGSIPSDISKLIPFVTTLDLSYNEFSGTIPVDLANITYLNDLKLDNNRLSGQIPLEFGQLERIKAFSVSNNILSGQVPNFTTFTISEDSYANNAGLCGKPLGSCTGGSKGPSSAIVAGAAIGGVIFAALVVAIGTLFYYRKYGLKRRQKKDDDPDGNKWAKSLKGVKGVKVQLPSIVGLRYLLDDQRLMVVGRNFRTLVSVFEKSISRMKLDDLIKATNNFNKENIIGSGRTGTVYKAVLVDGMPLMVKRLQDSQHTEKEFVSEMGTLGSVKHRNLVPLLGFCMAGHERFLGNLIDWIMELSGNSQLRDAIDKSLVGKGVDNEAFQVLKVACNCVGPNSKERPTMFEVYQLLRAIGGQYNFTTEDEILMPSDGGDTDFMEELIVARDVREHK
ncbi:hypothetical protein ACFE04_030787 [Oxalis oulophora]